MRLTVLNRIFCDHFVLDFSVQCEFMMSSLCTDQLGKCTFVILIGDSDCCFRRWSLCLFEKEIKFGGLMKLSFPQQRMSTNPAKYGVWSALLLTMISVSFDGASRCWQCFSSSDWGSRGWFCFKRSSQCDNPVPIPEGCSSHHWTNKMVIVVACEHRREASQDQNLAKLTKAWENGIRKYTSVELALWRRRGSRWWRRLGGWLAAIGTCIFEDGVRRWKGGDVVAGAACSGGTRAMEIYGSGVVVTVWSLIYNRGSLYDTKSKNSKWCMVHIWIVRKRFENLTQTKRRHSML